MVDSTDRYTVAVCRDLSPASLPHPDLNKAQLSSAFTIWSDEVMISKL